MNKTTLNVREQKALAAYQRRAGSKNLEMALHALVTTLPPRGVGPGTHRGLFKKLKKMIADQPKRCPFCGSTDKLEIIYFNDRGRDWAQVHCDECGACGPAVPAGSAETAWGRFRPLPDRGEQAADRGEHAAD